MRRFNALIFLLLAGCTQPTVDPSRLESIKSVAVLTLIGDEVRLRRVGLAVLQSDESTQSLPWEADARARKFVDDYLHGKGIQSVAISYDVSALSSRLYKTAPFESYADPKRISTDLQELNPRQSIDAFILISTDRASKGPVDYTNAGLYTEGTLKERLPVTPFIVLSLFVIDARSGSVIAKSSTIAQDVMYNLNPLWGIRPSTPPAPFFAGFKLPMNEEQVSFLRKKLQDLLPRAIETVLHGVGLTPKQ